MCHYKLKPSFREHNYCEITVYRLCDNIKESHLFNNDQLLPTLNSSNLETIIRCIF